LLLLMNPQDVKIFNIFFVIAPKATSSIFFFLPMWWWKNSQQEGRDSFESHHCIKKQKPIKKVQLDINMLHYFVSYYIGVAFETEMKNWTTHDLILLAFSHPYI
jgi:hypothetical protein